MPQIYHLASGATITWHIVSDRADQAYLTVTDAHGDAVLIEIAASDAGLVRQVAALMLVWADGQAGADAA